jgi:hypothetical protein
MDSSAENSTQIVFVKTVDDKGGRGNFSYAINLDGTNRREIFIATGDDLTAYGSCVLYGEPRRRGAGLRWGEVPNTGPASGITGSDGITRGRLLPTKIQLERHCGRDPQLTTPGAKRSDVKRPAFDRLNPAPGGD